jgi:hypothetical protein
MELIQAALEVEQDSTGSTTPPQDSSSHEQDVDILDSGSVSGTTKRTISE